MEKWVDEVGDLFRISLIGKKFIVSARSSLNKEVLRLRPNKFRRFSNIDQVMSEMGICGVFNAEGETWKNHRKLASEALNLDNVKSYYPTIAEITERLIRKFNKYAALNESFDVQKQMMRYTVDITTEIAFGYPMNTLEKGDNTIQKHLNKIFPMINSRITAPIPIWRLIKSKKDRDFDHSLNETRKLIIQFIKEGRQRLADTPSLKQNPKNFLEALLVQQEQKDKFTDYEIFGNIFTMLLAGEDTTSNTISWCIYYLSQNPHLIEKVRAEANVIYEESNIPMTYKEVSQLKVAEAVALEALRINPVTPNLYMTANEDVEIEGFRFRKGEQS